MIQVKNRPGLVQPGHINTSLVIIAIGFAQFILYSTTCTTHLYQTVNVVTSSGMLKRQHLNFLIG